MCLFLLIVGDETTGQISNWQYLTMCRRRNTIFTTVLKADFANDYCGLTCWLKWMRPDHVWFPPSRRATDSLVIPVHQCELWGGDMRDTTTLNCSWNTTALWHSSRHWNACLVTRIIFNNKVCVVQNHAANQFILASIRRPNFRWVPSSGGGYWASVGVWGSGNYHSYCCSVRVVYTVLLLTYPYA